MRFMNSVVFLGLLLYSAECVVAQDSKGEGHSVERVRIVGARKVPWIDAKRDGRPVRLVEVCGLAASKEADMRKVWVLRFDGSKYTGKEINVRDAVIKGDNDSNVALTGADLVIMQPKGGQEIGVDEAVCAVSDDGDICAATKLALMTHLEDVVRRCSGESMGLQALTILARKHPEVPKRCAYVQAIGEWEVVDKRMSIDCLVRVMKDDDIVVCREAVTVLGRVGRGSAIAVSALEEAARSADVHLKERARSALARLRAPG